MRVVERTLLEVLKTLIVRHDCGWVIDHRRLSAVTGWGEFKRTCPVGESSRARIESASIKGSSKVKSGEILEKRCDMSWWYVFHKKGGRREKEKNRRPSVPFATLFFFTGEASPPSQVGHIARAPKRVVQSRLSFGRFFFFCCSCLTIILIHLFGLWVVVHIYSIWAVVRCQRGCWGTWAEKKNSLKALKIQSGGQCLTSQCYQVIHRPWMANRATRPFPAIH